MTITHQRFAGLVVGIVGTLALGWALPAGAALVTVEAEDDNFVRGGTHANTVQNENGLLVIRGDNNANNRRKIYMKFDLTGFAGVEPALNEPATLTLTFSSGSGGGTGTQTETFGLRADSGLSGTNWSEAAIHWNNALANSTSGNRFTSDADSFGTVWMPYSSPAGTVYTRTIPRLGDYLQADGTVTLMIGPGENSSGTLLVGRTAQLFNSEHSTYAGPQLTFAQVPEPTTLLVWSLLAGLGVGLGWRRRK